MVKKWWWSSSRGSFKIVVGILLSGKMFIVVLTDDNTNSKKLLKGDSGLILILCLRIVPHLPGRTRQEPSEGTRIEMRS